jgi:hypothetical protein
MRTRQIIYISPTLIATLICDYFRLLAIPTIRDEHPQWNTAKSASEKEQQQRLIQREAGCDKREWNLDLLSNSPRLTYFRPDGGREVIATPKVRSILKLNQATQPQGDVCHLVHDPALREKAGYGWIRNDLVAERVGVEPTVEFPRHSLSRRAL